MIWESHRTRRYRVATGGQPAAAEEVASGERFAFGRNWQHFVTHLDEARIQDAVSSLSTFSPPSSPYADLTPASAPRARASMSRL